MRFRPTNILNPDCFMAGLYGRLSDEDRGKVSRYMESESIKNQRDYLHYTVAQLNQVQKTVPVEIYDEYYDDDYTGITFDRPNFQRMIKDVEEGKIDCIIVKDFSRFGRDYIRIIRYLEKDFERKNHQVRFVAYSDHYDSLIDKPDIGVRILLFLNEEYSRSQSHKVTTGMESMMRAGKFIGAFAPYGYIKDPENKHHLLIDEEVCENVREIFRMRLKEGLGGNEIARRLNERRIDPPSVYKEKQGYRYRNGNRITTTDYWTADTINRILQDEKYTGTMVQHKTCTKDFKSKEMELVAKKDWIRVPKTHEAIISKEDYDEAQLLHKAVTKNKNRTSEMSIFAGIIKCGDCRHSMIKQSETYKNKIYQSYHCRVHKKDSSRCYANRIYANTLTDIILEDINKIIGSTKELDKTIFKTITYEMNSDRTKIIKNQIAMYKDDINKQQAMVLGAQEKWLLGKLCDEQYEQIQDRCNSRKEQILRELQELEAYLTSNEDVLSNPWIKTLIETGRVNRLTREVVVEAIESIYVYHDNHIEINYKFKKES